VQALNGLRKVPAAKCLAKAMQNQSQTVKFGHHFTDRPQSKRRDAYTPVVGVVDDEGEVGAT
jgi:hypothetical protein